MSEYKNEIAEMGDEILDVEYDHVSDLVLQWQALDSHIDDYLRRLNDLTEELNLRALKRSVNTALSYVPVEQVMAVPGGQPLELGNGLVVTTK